MVYVKYVCILIPLFYIFSTLQKEVLYTVDSLYFVGYQFLWISWVAQSTNLKPQ